MTRIEEYMRELFSADSEVNEYAGFLGAYNLGLWGVSISGRKPLEQGLVVSGGLLKRAPRYLRGNRKLATNHVRFYDAPGIWGFKDHENRPWKDIAKKSAIKQYIDAERAWQFLVDRWSAVIAQSEYLVDLTTLGAPVRGSRVGRAVFKGITTCIKTWAATPERQGEDAAPLMIRIMFGNTGAATGGKTDWDHFLVDLAEVLTNINDGDAIANIDTPTKPIVLVGSDFGRTSAYANFNHSKIVAGDGQYAVVGGHNMCEEVSYTTAPVIHDVTAEVTGPGATSANAFAGSLWMKAAESGRLWIHRFNWETNRFDDLSTSATKLWAPDNYWYYERGTQEGIDTVLPDQPWYYPMQVLPDAPTVPPPRGSVPATAIMGIGRWGDTKVFGIDCSSGLKLGKEIPARHACQYASDYLKRVMIADPQNTLIRMSQQDLVNAGNFGMVGQHSDHTICEAIGNRLVATPRGTSFHIVVSTRYAQNSQGLSYSYGDGPREAAERISNTICGTGLTRFTAWPDRLAILDIGATPGNGVVHPIAKNQDDSYCTIAPLAFCNALGATRDRGTYVWPDAKYVYESTYGNNRFWSKLDKSEAKMGPGNHAKVMLVSRGKSDATGLIMIGSDNMYPSPLSEFNFVIEGVEAVAAFREQYWDPLWKYSARLGFTVAADGNVT